MDLAPIILFTYNRPDHTLQTLEALSQNTLADKSVLYIYCDGARSDANKETLAKIAEVREVIQQKKWCKEVHICIREKNYGTANNLINAVSKIIDQYGKVIVLEDDIVTSSGFLTYMNDALVTYEKEETVMHIAGYSYPTIAKNHPTETYFYNQTASWGWATWAQAWQHLNMDTRDLMKSIKNKKHFNLDGCYPFWDILRENLPQEWDVRWYASVYLKNGLCLHPKQTMIRNIGFDGSGIHCGVNDEIQEEFTTLAESTKVEKLPLAIDQTAREAIKDYFKKQVNSPNLVSRIKWNIIDYLHLNMGLNIN